MRKRRPEGVIALRGEARRSEGGGGEGGRKVNSGIQAMRRRGRLGSANLPARGSVLASPLTEEGAIRCCAACELSAAKKLPKRWAAREKNSSLDA